MPGIRPSWTVAALVAGLTFCSSALADQDPAAFPEGLDEAQLTAWLRTQTDVAPNHVVSITPSALLAVMQVRQTGPGPVYQMTVRGEILQPSVADRERMLSWYMPVELNCRTRRMRQGAITAYQGRNLIGDHRIFRPASPAWLAPPSGSGLAEVWRAACEADFRWPLVGRSEVIPKSSMAMEAREARPSGGADSGSPAPAPPPKSRPAKAAAPPKPEAPVVTAGRDRGARDYSVQIAAVSSEADARRELQAPFRLIQGNTQAKPRVERVTVGGKIYYRALLEGLTKRQAMELCARQRASGAGCMVRVGAPAGRAPRPALPQLRPSKK